MKRNVITISDNDKITVPDNIKMNITEISHLFGLYYQQTKKAIREIEKSNIAQGDFSTGGEVENSKIYPDYYGLDMVIGVAFRVNTYEADVFRKWILKRITIHQKQSPHIFIQLPSTQIFN